MALAFSALTQPGLLYQQYPPPLLPKPGKDNVRLKKLLKRTAKKKASAQTVQATAPFRSSLSPVNEASPDLEHSEHSTPPKTPDTPSSLYNIQPPARFTVRSLYQHVASPYPQRAAYGRAARFSPQTVTRVSSYSASTHLSGTSQPAFSTFTETHAGLRSPAVGGVDALTRPLTVLTPLVKSKSPRPTFKATEHSRSPKPMFDVPQIRFYTASTSYYEASRTPPVYDTAALTAIGSTVSQSKTPTETKQDLSLASEVRGDKKQMTRPPSLGSEPQRKTPTSEEKRGSTPAAEINIIITPTSETKRATPTSDIRAKTPTYEFQTSRTGAGRPRTPSYHATRAATPVFEVSRPNPLLFAVSPITVEPERSRSPKTVPAVSSSAQRQKTPEPVGPETVPNGDIHLDLTSAAKPIQQSITKSKSEPDLTRSTFPTASQRSETPTSEPALPAMTSYGFQRPKTPTYEASRLKSASPGYKRPKTPTYGTPRPGVSPVAFQRPKTPTQTAQKSKSTYRGLTPAEYAAYGGIKTYSPAFGITSSKTATQEEVTATRYESAESKTPPQEPPAAKEPPKHVDKPLVTDKKATAPPSIPLIVVSQASEVLETKLKQEAAAVSCLTAKKQSVIQQPPKPPAAEGKSPETPLREVAKPKTSDDVQDPLKVVRKLFGKAKAAEQKVETKVSGSVKPQDAAEDLKPSTATPALPVKPTGSEDKEKKAKTSPAVKPEKKLSDESRPAAAPHLKVLEKPKGLKSKLSGWSRLKKHMVVEQEEPKFPELGSQAVAAGNDQSDGRTADETTAKKPSAQDESKSKATPKATKMWDAVLFQMFSTKENIMHQIELNKSEKNTEEKKGEPKEIPSFAYRLPVLLFSPKFDAKKLREAVSRPVTKISTVFELGLIGRKGKDEEPKDFNRTARGFSVKSDVTSQEEEAETE
ncbi:uncharacterized protein prr33 [Aulostomus maculatus]